VGTKMEEITTYKIVCDWSGSLTDQAVQLDGFFISL
jgi:hypothetical protein